MASSKPLYRPPYDPALGPFLEQLAVSLETDAGNLEDLESVKKIRAALDRPSVEIKNALHSNPTITVQERVVPGPRGEIPIIIVRPASRPGGPSGQPGIIYYHGGAMVSGNAYFGMLECTPYVEAFGSTLISVDYRLAPEHHSFALVEDCYAALLWVADNLKYLDIDPDKLMIAGGSAGGGLAAATTLMARDKGGPKLCGQLLDCPMLDDRNSTISSRQFPDGIGYNSTKNYYAWRHVLGNQAGEEGVSYYISPSRAIDLSGLPPTFIDVGSADCFRDEDVAYASKLWECGVQAELHVWPGGNHGFKGMAPEALISKASTKARDDWVKRIFNK